MKINKTPIVVLDTNIYISAVTSPLTAPGKIIFAWKNRQIMVALSEPILFEIRDVLSRPYFAARLGWGKDKLELYINYLKTGSAFVLGKTIVNICRDPKDDMVLACALEVGADYIVSGDEDLVVLGQFKKIPIKTPRDFVDKVLAS